MTTPGGGILADDLVLDVLCLGDYDPTPWDQSGRLLAEGSACHPSEDSVVVLGTDELIKIYPGDEFRDWAPFKTPLLFWPRPHGT